MSASNLSEEGRPHGAVKHDRNWEHRFFAVFAAAYVVAVLVGFGPTFYLKPLFNYPPITRSIIWVHGFVMAAWVLLFVAQVYLISSKRIRIHQKLGILGVLIAVALVVSGFNLTIAAAKYGTAAAPADIPPLEFMIVPFGDLIVFSILFGAAVYFRKKAADHKRLILLTMICLAPPAIARFPGGMTASFGPLWFFGVPSVMVILMILGDWWRSGKLNKIFLAGGIFLVASAWLRLPVASTPLWLNFAEWLTS